MPKRRFPRHFRVRHTLPQHGWRDVLKVLRTGGFADEEAAARDAPKVPRNNPHAELTATTGPRVTWVGHATTVVQMQGQTFLTDPNWSDRIPGRIRRLTRPGVPWDSLPSVDGVLVSHDHYDHLDSPTIKRLPRSTPIHCGANLGRFFRRRGFREVHEHEWWESVTEGGVERTFVPVEHWCQRLVFDRDRHLWGGWVLRPEGATRGGVFFGGDCAYARWFKEVGERFPALDAAILPIGAYEPRWFMKNVHMDPDDAVRAFEDLGAGTLIPMHWGTFALTREPFLEPPERLRAAWAQRGLPESRLGLLPLGGSWEPTQGLADPTKRNRATN